MKVFLTGATGFLGTHIQEILEKRGIDYIALSRSPKEDPRFVRELLF